MRYMKVTGRASQGEELRDFYFRYGDRGPKRVTGWRVYWAKLVIWLHRNKGI